MIMIFDGSVQDEVDKVIAYAQAHRFDKAKVLRIANGEEEFTDPGHQIDIPGHNIRCVYAEVEQEYGWVRHLSMSQIQAEGGQIMPTQVAVMMSLDWFHFRKGGLLQKGRMFMPQMGNPPYLDVIELIDLNDLPKV